MPYVNNSPWLEVLFVMLPAVLTPLVAWFLSQRGKAKRTSELDHLLKRMDIVEKLRAFRPEGETRNYQQDLETEVEDIVADLAAIREVEEATAEGKGAGFTLWQRIFLTYEQVSVKGKIYKGLYYAFVIFALAAGWGMLLATQTPTVTSSGGFSTFGSIVVVIFGAGFYLFIGLLFRAAAVRNYKRKMGKGKLKNDS